MLLGMVLLYVGAVLVINGIWLVGQARAAAPAAAPAGPGEPVLAGGDVPVTRRAAEDHPAFITNHEIAILNVFTGFVGLLAAVTLAIHGNANADNAEIRAAAYIMLFAFTYLWVAYNQFTDVNGHAFGWYCLFVAITAVVAGIYAFSNANGNDATVYLGFDWIAWAILWFMFFVLLALERPIARITGYVAILEGIGTSWVFALLLLQDELSF
ncbi:MAG TPA: AmiS/UreI family transporter [Conexibacter sp.]|nr:AmiS/UreI family transporter [Conexibacter sp.]